MLQLFSGIIETKSLTNNNVCYLTYSHVLLSLQGNQIAWLLIILKTSKIEKISNNFLRLMKDYVKL